ncbi:MAG: Os1348 family NHLP clan protein [Actinomycetota bacterium]|nr:Os1348 family NHLP clan protein [Actinomycetota bacterium]
MAGIDEVLERLVGDAEFRKTLAEDPKAALAGYDLTREDLELLSAQLDESTGGEHGVEQRTSKSAMMGLIAGIVGAGEASGSSGESVRWIYGEDATAFSKDQSLDEIAPTAPETESGDYAVWRDNFGTADQTSGGEEGGINIGPGSVVTGDDTHDASTQVGKYRLDGAWPKKIGVGELQETMISKSMDSATGDSSVGTTEVAAAESGGGSEEAGNRKSASGGLLMYNQSGPEDTSAGDPDRPLITGRVYNSEAGETGDPNDPAGFIQVEEAPDAPSELVGSEGGPEDPAAAGGHVEVESEVEEGEK